MAKVIRGAVRLDKAQSIYAGNIESVQATVDLENGSIVAIDGLAGNGGEIVTGAAPTDVATQEVLLVYSDELLYDEKRESILDFINEAGKPARAYHYTVGDIVTVTDKMIEGTSVVGQYLIPENGALLLKAVASTTVTDGDDSYVPRFTAQVIAKENLFGQPATVYRVLSC